MGKPTIHADTNGQLYAENLELLLNGLNDFIFICDQDWQLVYSNDKVYKATGYRPEEIVGKQLTDFQQGFYKIDIKEITSHLLQNEKMATELPFTSKSGNTKKLLVSIKKINLNGDKALLFVTNDVTDYAVMKDQLRHVQAREEALLDNIPFQAWLKDEDGVIITANTYFAQAFGLNKTDIKGKTDFDLCDKPVAEKYLAQDREVIEKGEQKYEDHFWINGEKRWYETIKSPIKNEDGEVIGTTGIARDISDARKARILMEKNIQQQKLLTQVAYQLNRPINFKTRINEVIKALGEHLKVSRVYIFENDNEARLTHNTYEWCAEGIQSQMETLDPVPFDFVPSWWKLLHESGSINSSNINELPDDIVKMLESQGIVSILVHPIIIEDELFGFIGLDDCVIHRNWSQEEDEFLKTISHMISNAFQQFKYEDALLKSERKFRELVEMLPEMIAETDAEGYITFGNQLAYKRFNYDKKIVEERKLHVFDLFAEADKPRAVEVLEKVVRGKPMENDDHEFTAVTQDGQTFPVLVFVNPTFDHGEFQGLRGVMVDISERKAGELKLLEAKQKAEAAARAKEHFLATMSHEIRTPLNAIIGCVNLMKDKEQEQDKDLLETLELSSRQLLNLINDILDFSKIEVGKLTIQTSDLHLESLLRNVMKLFQQRATERGIELTLDIHPDTPQNVLGDGSRIMQILNNLVSNAIKFTEKGSVQIAVKPGQKLDGDKVLLRFEVKDTGLGIPEAKQRDIFESFTQVESTNTRKYEGTGLGLAITQKLVELMEGNIEVESVLEKGSTFSFTIPMKLSASGLNIKTNQARDATQEDLQGTNILLVEDNLINQKIAAKFLKKWKADVDIAENGKEALLELNHRPYDLILMDLQMPVMDGFQATKKIRALESSGKNTPIIALTASALLEVQREVFGAGMNDYITKPFDPKDLFKKITKAIKDDKRKQAAQ